MDERTYDNELLSAFAEQIQILSAMNEGLQQYNAETASFNETVKRELTAINAEIDQLKAALGKFISGFNTLRENYQSQSELRRYLQGQLQQRSAAYSGVQGTRQQGYFPGYSRSAPGGIPRGSTSGYVPPNVESPPKLPPVGSQEYETALRRLPIQDLRSRIRQVDTTLQEMREQIYQSMQVIGTVMGTIQNTPSLKSNQEIRDLLVGILRSVQGMKTTLADVDVDVEPITPNQSRPGGEEDIKLPQRRVRQGFQGEKANVEQELAKEITSKGLSELDMVVEGQSIRVNDPVSKQDLVLPLNTTTLDQLTLLQQFISEERCVRRDAKLKIDTMSTREGLSIVGNGQSSFIQMIPPLMTDVFGAQLAKAVSDICVGDDETTDEFKDASEGPGTGSGAVDALVMRYKAMMESHLWLPALTIEFQPQTRQIQVRNLRDVTEGRDVPLMVLPLNDFTVQQLLKIRTRLLNGKCGREVIAWVKEDQKSIVFYAGKEDSTPIQMIPTLSQEEFEGAIDKSYFDICPADMEEVAGQGDSGIGEEEPERPREEAERLQQEQDQQRREEERLQQEQDQQRREEERLQQEQDQQQREEERLQQDQQRQGSRRSRRLAGEKTFGGKVDIPKVDRNGNNKGTKQFDASEVQTTLEALLENPNLDSKDRARYEEVLNANNDTEFKFRAARLLKSRAESTGRYNTVGGTKRRRKMRGGFRYSRGAKRTSTKPATLRKKSTRSSTKSRRRASQEATEEADAFTFR